ncbi:MAG: sigma-70 family RNA polymerase sigma factor [bacterium]|nr:sigma-70 family RNA polymerase sigma factor [bacterium]
MLPDFTSRNPIEALLKDEAWLRRLARGLVGEAGADDLTQDVLVAAIKTPPRERGVQLRAWAKTVARRMAMRRGGRDRTRQLAEQGAARPEEADQHSEQRLLLHRRLTDSILSLEAPYRTVLVMRYLEEQQPVEIAERLQITPAAARKRISRGLAKLRELLDSEFGDRGQWMHALGPMAFGAGWQEMLPSAQAAAAGTPPATVVTTVGSTTAFSLTPILALWTMKKLILTSVVLCLAIFAGYEILGSAQTDLEEPGKGENQAGLVPMAEPKTESSPLLVSSESTEVRDQASPIAPIPAASRLAQIILVDSDGVPAPGGKGAWLTASMEVHPLTFDGKGRAVLPEGAVGSLCLVRAEGFAIQDFLVESVEDDYTVQLGPLQDLKGWILADGEPLSEAVDIDCDWEFRPTTPFERTTFRIEDEHRAQLEQLGLMSGRCSTRSLPGGAFLFEGVQPGSQGDVELPRYLKTLPGGWSSSASFRKNQENLVIKTTSLPHVLGRLVWADDGTPYMKTVNVAFTNHRNEDYGYMAIQPTENGGLAVTLDFLSSDKTEGLKDISIRVVVEGGSRNGGQEFQIPVSIESPAKDVGILKVNRRNLLNIRVVDASGQPVQEAFVETSRGHARTDVNGLVTLATAPDGMVLALAKGHGFAVLETDSAEANSEGQYLIRLPEGNDLTIAPILEQAGLSVLANTSMQIDLPEELLGAPLYGDRIALQFYQMAVGQTGMAAWFDWGVRLTVSGMSPPSVLPGLKPGTRIKARLRDASGQVIARGVAVIPQEARPSKLELVPDPAGLGFMEFEVVGERGQRLGSTSVHGLEEGWRIPTFQDPSGRLVVGPLMTGSYRFRVGARGHAPIELELSLTPGTHRRKVVLLPGRLIEAQFSDANGIALHPEWARLQDSKGETIFSKSKEKPEWFEFTYVPKEPVVLVAQVGTQTIQHAIGAEEVKVEIRLPATGKLRMHAEAFPVPTGNRGSLTMRIPGENSADDALLTRSISFAEGATKSWDLEANLEPGGYPVLVSFCSDRGAPGKTATRTLFEGRVTIVAGEETLIVVSGGKNPTATLTPR